MFLSKLSTSGSLVEEFLKQSNDVINTTFVDLKMEEIVDRAIEFALDSQTNEAVEIISKALTNLAIAHPAYFVKEFYKSKISNMLNRINYIIVILNPIYFKDVPIKS